MSDDPRPSAVERFAKRTIPESEAEPLPRNTTTSEYEAFSMVSANRRAEIMLEFRFKNGDSVALPYAYLLSIHWNPSEGIRLAFAGDRLVVLRGRHLDLLRHGLIRHQVTWVQEIDTVQAHRLPPETPFIDELATEGL